MIDQCGRILMNGIFVDLLVEIIAFRRELVKVLPGLPDCYAQFAMAMMGLQRLDEAEALVHEGIAACEQNGQFISTVSQKIGRHSICARQGVSRFIRSEL
jgi:hypothetical protein